MGLTPAGRSGCGCLRRRAPVRAMPYPAILSGVTEPREVEVETPHGPARVHLHGGDGLPAALVLGHGAGGGVAAPDLVAVTELAVRRGLAVALVEQPYRVAGRRSSPPAKQLDAAWIAVVERLRGGELAGVPLIAGGRSAGARVACRTAAATDAVAVLCLAFPLQPPRRAGGKESPSRLDELEGVAVPMLVVQGEGDQFGMPPEGPHRVVARVRGNHSLRSDRQPVIDAVAGWLPIVVPVVG